MLLEIKSNCAILRLFTREPYLDLRFEPRDR